MDDEDFQEDDNPYTKVANVQEEEVQKFHSQAERDLYEALQRNMGHALVDALRAGDVMHRGVANAIDWLRTNTGLTEVQREMADVRVGALERRLVATFRDDNTRRIDADRFIQSGLAVDDRQESHQVTTPLLMCVERPKPQRQRSDKDYETVLVTDAQNKPLKARYYVVLLYANAHQSLFMWLTKPFAGQIQECSATHCCQFVLSHYVSSSNRTKTSGYDHLKYVVGRTAISDFLLHCNGLILFFIGIFRRVSASLSTPVACLARVDRPLAAVSTIDSTRQQSMRCVSAPICGRSASLWHSSIERSVRWHKSARATTFR